MSAWDVVTVVAKLVTLVSLIGVVVFQVLTIQELRKW